MATMAGCSFRAEVIRDTICARIVSSANPMFPGHIGKPFGRTHTLRVRGRFSPILALNNSFFFQGESNGIKKFWFRARMEGGVVCATPRAESNSFIALTFLDEFSHQIFSFEQIFI